MAFVVERELKLNDLGAGWEDAYVVMSSLSFREAEELSSLKADPENPESKENVDTVKVIGGLLSSKFIRGKAFDGKELVEMTGDDILDLPADVVGKIVSLLAGTISPN